MMLSLVVLAVTVTCCLSCDIETIRGNAQSSDLVGGYQRISVEAPAVVQLRDRGAQGVNAVTRGVHVTEAYRQLVNGYNYCIRFSAAGRCAADGLCQSFECVTGGHQPLPNDGNEADVTPRDTNCYPAQLGCNITAVREMAKSPVPGGWTERQETAEDIVDLYGRAAQIAAVGRGNVVEAYKQTVAGYNYCIRFASTGAENCRDSCRELTCSASGHLPVPGGGQETFIKVGVNCEPTAARGSNTATRTVGGCRTCGVGRGAPYSGNGAMTSSMTSFVTSLVTGLAALVAVGVL